MKKIVSVLILSLVFIISYNSFSQSLNNIASQPYFEGFEGAAFPPAGWQTINVSGNVIWMIGYFAHTGSKAAVCAWQATGVGEDWMITPRWNIQSGDSLAFWLRPFFVGNPPDSLAVRVSTTDSNMSSFTTRILFIAEGNGYPTTTVYQRYAVSLNQFAGQGIFIAFKHMDQNGDGIFIDDISVERIGPSGISILNQVPKKFELMQNYPNPFNPVTKIRFSLPKSSNVTLKLNDITGREIKTLVDSKLETGSYEYIFEAIGLSSGVYMYKLTAGEYTSVKRMVLVK